jgi:cysteinyl-tRNA synthetase
MVIILHNSNTDIINLYFHQIIVKARQEYLYDEYVKAGKATYQELVEDLKSALLLIKGKFDNELDKDKKEMYKKLVNRIEAKINSESQDDINKTIGEFQDVLSIWLDKEKGKTVNKNEIFFDLPKRFETSYHDDMAALNVKYLLTLLTYSLVLLK